MTEPDGQLVRLNKHIADSGFCARRKADDFISTGRVQVNGQTVTTLGLRIDPAKQSVTIDGQPLPTADKLYVLFHKPVGVVTSRRAGRHQRSIYELLDPAYHGVDPAGRLDQDSSGLLILSTDGDFIHRITHPRYHVPKRYEVELDQPVQPEDLERLTRGIVLQPENKLARMLDIELLSPNQAQVTLITGYNRQIRRSFEALGYTVTALKRLAFGPILLESLPPGGTRLLRPEERHQLLAPAAPPE